MFFNPVDSFMSDFHYLQTSFYLSFFYLVDVIGMLNEETPSIPQKDFTINVSRGMHTIETSLSKIGSSLALFSKGSGQVQQGK